MGSCLFRGGPAPVTPTRPPAVLDEDRRLFEALLLREDEVRSLWQAFEGVSDGHPFVKVVSFVEDLGQTTSPFVEKLFGLYASSGRLPSIASWTCHATR